AGALEFDGVDDYVDCGNPAILDPGTGDFTISAWIKGSVDPGTDTLIFSKGGDSGGGIRYELMLRDNNNGDIKVLVDDDNDKYDPSSDTVGLLDGAWHHIVGMRRNGTDLRVYIDGVEDMGVTNHNESTIPETYDLSGTSQANAHIGANWHNEDKVVQKFFLGLIDDVRVACCGPVTSFGRTKTCTRQQDCCSREEGQAGIFAWKNDFSGLGSTNSGSQALFLCERCPYPYSRSLAATEATHLTPTHPIFFSFFS
ncbi:MAG: LamG domain-containing protein, partial [Planctomycetota bacterium]